MIIPFEANGLFGLQLADKLVLAPEYDAVWPLPYGFWGYRRGEFFGVLTAAGAAAGPCKLPARHQGFAELTIDEELEAVLEPEATFVPFMRQRFPALHMHYDHLCQPTSWLAETITPHLADEEEELWLYAPEYCLILKPDGSWQHLKRPPKVRDEKLYFLSQHSAAFETVVPAEFEPAEVEDLLRWRLRLTELSQNPEEADAADALSWALADGKARSNHFNHLEEVLTSSGIRSLKPIEGVDIPFYKPFDITLVAPQVRQACEDHLNTIFEVDADSREIVDQLIYLAWLWANDFVFYDERNGMHWVDGRYEFDNGWFDNHIIDNIYSDYELDKLVPLLRQPGTTAS
jgi:hypothetical protein